MAAPVRTVISPGRYVQGKGSIHQLGEYLKPIGSTPLLVADDLVWGLVGHGNTIAFSLHHGSDHGPSDPWLVLPRRCVSARR